MLLCLQVNVVMLLETVDKIHEQILRLVDKRRVHD